jgi:hypothetical protein
MLNGARQRTFQHARQKIRCRLKSGQPSGTFSTTADWASSVPAETKQLMDTISNNRGRQADWPSELPALGWKDVLWRLWAEFNEESCWSRQAPRSTCFLANPGASSPLIVAGLIFSNGRVAIENVAAPNPHQHKAVARASRARVPRQARHHTTKASEELPGASQLCPIDFSERTFRLRV